MILPRLAGWCYRRRRFVVGAWVVALVGISVLGQTAGGTLQKTFTLPGTESQRAFDVLDHDFGRKGDTGDLVSRARSGADVHAPPVQQAITPVMNELRAQPHVVSVTS